MRIKFIIPFPLGPEGIAKRAAQARRDVLDADTTVDCVPVRNSTDAAGSDYDLALLDMYVAEAGLRAEEEGYDAVVMDTVTDSGLQALRSRLSIPVADPGPVACPVGAMLGRRLSMVTCLDEHKPLYEKAFRAYGVADHCASVRAANIVPDFEALLGPGATDKLERFTCEAQAAIE